MKIYVASSWRNTQHSDIVKMLRSNGHEVYDFKQAGSYFNWSAVDMNWQNWTYEEYIDALENHISQEGFLNDFTAMQEADLCVLVLPCGRSAHLEAGYFVGASKPLIIVMDLMQEPELMYLMATSICRSNELTEEIEKWNKSQTP